MNDTTRNTNGIEARYDAYCIETGNTIANTNALTAAELLGLSTDELEWAIEEEGRCSTDGWIVVLSPAGFTPVERSRICCLFWQTFVGSRDAAIEDCGLSRASASEHAAQHAAEIAGDEANTIYDETQDEDCEQLNAWFGMLVAAAEQTA